LTYGGFPKNYPFSVRIFHEINHPAIYWGTPILGNLHIASTYPAFCRGLGLKLLGLELDFGILRQNPIRLVSISNILKSYQFIYSNPQNDRNFINPKTIEIS
jgi:hypothetical protein